MSIDKFGRKIKITNNSLNFMSRIKTMENSIEDFKQKFFESQQNDKKEILKSVETIKDGIEVLKVYEENSKKAFDEMKDCLKQPPKYNEIAKDEDESSDEGSNN